MPEITLPKSEFSQGAVNINLNKYLPEKKKKLANLSDEELAELSPEELEEAKQVRANLLAIKQTSKEVENMDNQEKWAAAVQAFADAHGISAQEAEDILKKRAGVNSPTDLATVFAALKPEPNPIEKAISEAIAQRANNIVPLLFGNPPDNTGGKSAQTALSDALKLAKDSGAQSIYLPDGTMVKLGEDKGGNQDSILQGATTQIRQYVENLVNQRLPTLFNPQTSGMPQVGNNASPEITRLVLEDKWKQEDRLANDTSALRRDNAVKDIAAVIGAMFSPEGFKKMQMLLKEGPTGMAGAGEKGEIETKPEAKLLKATCWKCLRVFPYEEGQDPVCPFCNQAQKVQCPKCEEVFIPKRRDKIVCPKCHAELLQTKPEEQGKPPEKETPEESSAPGVSVGSGLE